MPNNDENKSTPTVFGVCRICGSLYPLTGKEDPGFCGRKSCQASINNSRVVSTPVYGSNVNIITYGDDGYGTTIESNTNVDNGVNNVSITRNIDTTQRDLENAKQIEKEFDRKYANKATKKAKSKRVSKSSK